MMFKGTFPYLPYDEAEGYFFILSGLSDRLYSMCQKRMLQNVCLPLKGVERVGRISAFDGM